MSFGFTKNVNDKKRNNPLGKTVISKGKYFAIYTCVFAICFYFCFLRWFIAYDKTMFRSYDGLDQHYLSFVYIGKWFRTIFKNIFIEHHFEFPMWEMGIGYGSDILTSMGAYLPDPFNWISMFFPARYAEYGFSLMITLKVYCSGIAFSWLALRRKNRWEYTLAGSLIYAFSATVYIVFIESFFINPMYIFPFVIGGADSLWENKTSKTYVFSLAFSFINYFYFGYMTCLFIVGYFVVKFFTDKKISGWKNFWSLVWKFLWNSVVGVAMSCIVLLPILLVMTGAGRLGLKYYLPVFYDKQFYKNLIAGFSGVFSMSGRDAIMGYTVIATGCVFFLFLQKKKFTRLKIEFLILSAGLCIPAFGSLLNGGSYYANRWVWAYALLIGYIVTVVLPLVSDITDLQKFILLGMVLLYVFLIVIGFSNFNIEIISICLFFLFVLFVLFLMAAYFPKWFAAVSVLLSMLAVILNAGLWFSKNHGNATSSETQRGTAYSQIMESGAMPLLNKLGVSAAERYDEAGIYPVRNASWLYGISGEDLYISIHNNNVDEFHNDIALLTSHGITNEYSGLNRRTDLEYLFGVNHFMVPGDEKELLPYGYTREEITESIRGKVYSSFKPVVSTSLFHGFSKVTGEDEFKNLSPYEKQQVLMKAIVTPDSSLVNTGAASLLSDDEVTWKATYTNLVHNGEMYTASEGAEMDLDFAPVSNAEIYVYVEGLDYENGDKVGSGIDFYNYRNNVESGYSTHLSIINNKTHMYGGRHNWLVNTGYFPEKVNKLKLVFTSAGEYTIKNLRVYVKPERELSENINNLENVCTKCTINCNKIQADLETSESEQILLSVPYSTGWKLKVDGKRQDLRLADDAFMNFSISGGIHHIEMKYVTPGLIPGTGISVISLIFYLFIDRYYRKRKMRK